MTQIDILFPGFEYHLTLLDGDALNLSSPLIQQMDSAARDLAPNMQGIVDVNYIAGQDHFTFKITAKNGRKWEQVIKGPFPSGDPEMNHECDYFSRSDFISMKAIREVAIAFANSPIGLKKLVVKFLL